MRPFVSRAAIITLAVLMLAPLATSWSQPSQPPQPPQPAATLMEFADKVKIGEPKVFRNLAIYPLVGQGPFEAVKYLTLDEGTAKNLVQVREVGGDENNRNPRRQQLVPREQQNAPHRNQQQQPQRQNAPDKSREVPSLDRVIAALEHAKSQEAPNPHARAIQLIAAQLDIVAVERREWDRRRQQLDVQGRQIPAAEYEPITTRLEQLDRLARLLHEQLAEINARVAAQRLNVPQQEQAQQAQQAQQDQQADGAQVNSLEVENQSDLPLYLMCGEVVLGGQQDRIVAIDTIIPAKSKALVRVFCVEPGRWAGQARFNTGNAVVHGKLRGVAQDKKGQQEVWDEVRQTNKQLGNDANNASETYRKNLEDEKVVARKAEYTKYFDEAFKLDDTLVGCVVVIRGEFAMLDRFGSPSIFKALWPKLLKSYILSAILEAAEYVSKNQGADIDATCAPMTLDAVCKFYKAACAKAAVNDETGQQHLRCDKRDDEKWVGFTNNEVDTADPGKSRMIHESFYKK